MISHYPLNLISLIGKLSISCTKNFGNGWKHILIKIRKIGLDGKKMVVMYLTV